WYYQERGDFDKAKPLYLKALDIRRKIPAGESSVADTLQNLAWLYYYDGPRDEMDKCFKEALEIRESLLRTATSHRKMLLRDVVFTKLGMAAASAGQGRLPNALRIVRDQELRAQMIDLYNNEDLVNALAAFVSAVEHSVSFQREIKQQAVSELTKALAFIREGRKAETALGDKAESILEGRVHYELARTLT